MNKRKVFFLFLTVSVLLLSLPDSILAQGYPGTNIRGQIMTYNPYSGQNMPVGGIAVDIYQINPYTGKYMLMGHTISNAYGFYFMNGVRPGSYVLVVGGNRGAYNIAVYQIDYRIYQFQDIPVINI